MTYVCIYWLRAIAFKLREQKGLPTFVGRKRNRNPVLVKIVAQLFGTKLQLTYTAIKLNFHPCIALY